MMVCFLLFSFQFRVYAPPDKVEQTQYALDIGINITNYYEDYFQLDYPLPKLGKLEGLDQRSQFQIKLYERLSSNFRFQWNWLLRSSTTPFLSAILNFVGQIQGLNSIMFLFSYLS